ncbi:MAG: PD40 domain-containing protein [Bacteroidia bacterium]|nr:PD40 domain-containing protein [Bacteroidia bacterium]
MRFYLLIITGLLICMGSVFSQENPDAKARYSEADKLFDAGNYSRALPIYLELQPSDASNANLNYKIGYCYLNTSLKIQEAIDFLSKANSDVAAPFETPFILAKAYHLNYESGKALGLLKMFILIASDNADLKKKVQHETDMCNNAAELVSAPVNMYVSNLGTIINSEYPDYNPVVSADESVLVFTSRRPGGTGNKQSADGRFNGDIYISKKANNEWSKPESISPNINTDGNEAAVSLSADGSQLLIYKNDNGDGNIYISKFEGNSWSVPQKLGPAINSKYNENNAFLFADGNAIYFTSDRKGGYGGMDIYMSRKLPNGEWGEAVNLGPKINTEYDEQSPYVQPDGYTFFFSSEGHKSMGGQDIFYCMLNDDATWSEPINIGYPINTAYDDLFYSPSLDGKRAYYCSSSRKEGLGGFDIYLISTLSTVKQLSVVTGFLKLENSTGSESEIIVTDSDTKEITGKFVPNSNNGKFLMVLSPRKNNILFCNADGYIPYMNNLVLSRKSSYQESESTISLDTILLRKTYQFYSFTFLAYDSTVSLKSETKLEILTEFLKLNELKVEIIGKKAEISGSRVRELMNYFIKAGISTKRFNNSYSSTENDENTIDIMVYNIQGENVAMEELTKRKFVKNPQIDGNLKEDKKNTNRK